MIELERAQKLCQAIDELLEGSHRVYLGDPELQELLLLAKRRQDAAARHFRTSRERQDEVLLRVLARLDARQGREARRRFHLVGTGAVAIPFHEDAPSEAAKEHRRAVSLPRFSLRLSVPGWPSPITKRYLALASGPIVLAALVIVALDPVADQSLASQVARLIGLGPAVMETATPPQVPASFKVIEGREVSTLEAGSLLQLPITEPAFLPDGFAKVSSKFFPSPDEGRSGFFLLTYTSTAVTSPSATIMVQQQNAHSGDLAVLQGTASPMTLSGDIPATYVLGSWEALGNNLSWSNFQAQSVIFDKGDVRTVLRYSGPSIDPTLLRLVAESMLAAN